MSCSIRTLSHALFACAVFIGLTSCLRAQTNSTPWPSYPPVGIGTQLDGGPVNALHIHYDPAHSTLPAILRLSQGAWDTDIYYGALALMTQDSTSAYYAKWSNLAMANDLILHEQRGDLVLANYNQWSGAIRLSTTPVPTTIPIGTPFNDLERMTIDQNGNVGIDIPPTTGTPSLCAPLDQVQIGGGVQPPIGSSYPTPGLTIYGGTRFENLLQNGKIPAGDRRYISYNHYIDHTDTGLSRFHRFQPMGSSEIDFSSDNGGLLSFNTEPYDATRGLNSFSHKMVWELSGTYGSGIWLWDTAATVQKHTFFEINPPGIKLGSVTRNTNGLAFFHTPVCITSDTASYMSIDFQNLPVRPDIGDDSTWDLVVNGPALFKEAWVNTNDWPDYVFLPDFKLRSIQEFGKYIETEHHLPDVPAADKMGGAVPLGKTEANLTKQVEELSLYIVQLNKEVTALKSEVEGLKNGEEK